MTYAAPQHHVSIGFTGTQRGMTQAQFEKVAVALELLEPTEVHHGDCIGADAQFHDIVAEFFPHVTIFIHPPKNPSKRAFKKGHYIYEPDDYLVRNKAIVNASGSMIATPGESEEVIRSGTWSTIRFAKKQNKTTFIIAPDATIL